jgi:hypothetical protein
MDSLALNIERGHAGGRQHHGLLAGYAAEVLEQGGFAGACASRNKNTPARLLHDVQGAPELLIYLDILHGCVSRLYNTTRPPKPDCYLRQACVK